MRTIVEIETDEIIQIIDALLQELHDLLPEADTDRQHIKDDLDLFQHIETDRQQIEDDINPPPSGYFFGAGRFCRTNVQIIKSIANFVYKRIALKRQRHTKAPHIVPCSSCLPIPNVRYAIIFFYSFNDGID
jgi:hypothetical protein